MRKRVFVKRLTVLYSAKVIYGPYKTKSDMRRRAMVVTSAGRQITKQYAKFKMEIKLGKILPRDITVDHIDEDVTNDSYRNLQLLTHSKNVIKSIKRVDPKTLFKCVWCKDKFAPTANQREGKGTALLAGPFCSRSCSGQYGAALQNNRTKVLKGNRKVAYLKGI